MESTHQLLTQVISYGVPVASAFAAFVLALVLGIVKFLRKNMSNGNGLTLRQAVDDLAADFRQHRVETNDRLSDIAERIGSVESRMGRVETKAAEHSE